MMIWSNSLNKIELSELDKREQKRGHAGSMIFTDFDRSALYDVKHASNINGKPLKYYRKATDVPAGGRSRLLGTNLEPGDLRPLGHSYPTDANYSDQIPPQCRGLQDANLEANSSNSGNLLTGSAEDNPERSLDNKERATTSRKTYTQVSGNGEGLEKDRDMVCSA
jgi:hypothetical protein